MGPHSPSAADEQGVVRAGVQIDHHLGPDGRRVEPLRPDESRLLLDGEQTLQIRMEQLVVIENCQHIGYRYAVVRSQSRPLGVEKTVPLYKLNGVFHKIVNGADVFLTHHVHMALKQHRVLHPGRWKRRLADQNVSHFISGTFQIMGKGKAHQIIPQRFFISRTPRNSADFPKITEKRLRFPIEQITHIDLLPFSSAPYSVESAQAKAAGASLSLDSAF